MIEWTETARRVLDEYCARTKTVLAGSGADVDEVVDDLRRHIDQEVTAAGLKVVTEADLRRLLARLGEPGAAVEKKPDAGPPAAAPGPVKDKKRPGFILLVLGVVLPLGTLIFELLTGISAGVVFDPLPTWFQVLAVALVPVANFWIWRAGRARDARRATLLGWLNGIAIGVCFYFVLLYLPLTPFAAIGIIYFGLGLVPLTPLIALTATPFLRASYGRQIAKETLPGAGWGALAGFGFLVLLQVPTALTYRGLTRAASDDPATRMQGVRLLRSFGDRELMLRACYGLLRREINLDLVRFLASGDRIVSADQAREIYYRVTGKSFNSVPPPSLYTRMGRWTDLDEEFVWDDALGGEQVAGRVKGLSLASSRMDAVAEPDAALVYCEWTLEFKNIATRPREARAQIALPPGAVVSRLTLWVNGEEREAAFGGRSQVRQAYQEVAVARRRDPVLVTTCGPDRVLVQCFPVPANGGVMKVRLGITAPVVLESLDRGRFLWPHLLERNFSVPAGFKHSLWIESAAPLAGAPGAIAAAKTETHPFTLRETVSDAEFADAARSVAVSRSVGVETVWSPVEGSGQVIRQIIQPAQSAPPARLVIVVDGSVGMQKFVPDIAAALAEVPETAEIALVVAGDEARVLNGKPQRATPAVASEIGRSLGGLHCVGGEDNVPALELAWDLASAVENGAIVWIHQPQPALLSPESALRQGMERNATATRLFEIQTGNGPDRIMEKLDGLKAARHVPRFGSVRSDLGGLLAQWTGKSHRFELVRERVAATPEAETGPRASKHLERLWARDETLRLVSRRDPDAAAKLAADHQLVTPLTGAVVLETQQQFAQHGLTPADAKTVPAVPEPQPGLLLAVAMIAWAVWRFKQRTRRVGA